MSTSCSTRSLTCGARCSTRSSTSIGRCDVLMRLLWGFAEPFVSLLLGTVPEAPEPVSWAIPWPAAVSPAPFLLSIVTIVTAGALFLLIRLTRWVYGLVPVVQ